MSLMFIAILPSASIESAGSGFSCGTDHSGLHARKTGDEILNGACNTDLTGEWTTFGDLDSYIPGGGPLALQATPRKTIALSFHIMQKSDGTGNFQNIAAHKTRLKQMLAWVNEFYSSGQPSDPVSGVTELAAFDSRIQFTLGPVGQERIYFHQEDALWQQGDDAEVLKNYVELVDPEQMRYLNIFWTGGHFQAEILEQHIQITNGGSGYSSPPTVVFSHGGAQANAVLNNGQVVGIVITNGGSYAGISPPTISLGGGGGSGATAVVTQITGGASAFASFPSQTDFARRQHVVMLRNTGGGNDWATAGVLAHELGHCLALHHTYDGGGAPAICNNDDDYLDDVFGPHASTSCPHEANWTADAWDASIPDHEKITNNLMGGNSSVRYESPKQAGIMHRSLALSSLRRHVLETYNGIPLNISNNQTWDFDIKLYRDISIAPGARLTIKCRVVMPAQGRITVEPGGQLILDGGTVTAEENWKSMWQGIILRPRNGFSQHPIGNSPQAVLTMKNGGSIEFARIAVHAENGGVVQAWNSSFRNNQSGVEFYWYTNSLPSGPLAGTPQPNLSYFDNCDFETTALFNYSAQLPKQFVYLEHVDGITFRGCRFRNTAPENFHINNRGSGIIAQAASFSVLRHCRASSPLTPTGCSDYRASSFENLRYGIHAEAAGQLRSISVNKADFSACWRGLYLKSVDRSDISQCSFDVGPYNSAGSVSPSPQSYGVYLHSSTGYKIHENYFTSSYDGDYGIVIHQTGADAQEIYKNTFEGLKIASAAQNHNFGLQFKCNNYIDNVTADIMVAGKYGRIASPQGACGSAAAAAGNTFTNDCDPSWSWKEFWVSLGGKRTGYVHHPNPGANVYTEPICLAPKVVLSECIHDVYNEQSCLSRLVPISMSDNKAERERLTDGIIGIGGNGNGGGIIDNGDTGGLVQLLQDMTTPGSTVYSSLEAASPYLSDIVLESLVVDGPAKLAQDEIADLLINNSPISEEIYQLLLAMDPPMPGALIEEIDEVQVGLSERELLEGQLAELERERAFVSNAIWREYLEREDYHQAIAELIEYQEELYAGGRSLEHALLRMMIETQLHGGSGTRALEILDDYCANGGDAEYCTLLNLLIGLKNEERTILELNAGEEASLRLLAESNSPGSLAPARAQAILSMFGDDEWLEEIHDPELSRNSADAAAAPLADSPIDPGPMTLKLYPNPAKEKVTVEFNPIGRYEQFWLNVYTALGIRFARFELSSLTQFDLQCSGWPSGMYYLDLVADGRSLGRCQLTIAD